MCTYYKVNYAKREKVTKSGESLFCGEPTVSNESSYTLSDLDKNKYCQFFSLFTLSIIYDVTMYITTYIYRRIYMYNRRTHLIWCCRIKKYDLHFFSVVLPFKEVKWWRFYRPKLYKILNLCAFKSKYSI